MGLMIRFIARFVGFLLGLLLLGGAAAAAALYLIYQYYEPQLPPTAALKEVQMAEPLRIYSRDGQLITEYGEIKRVPLSYSDFPPLLLNAFLAAEDSRFFVHQGVDPVGMLRAALELVKAGGEKRQGASTITMQVARNFFLSREKTYERKIKEILLSLKIERELTKEEIFQLYLNKIYLGKRAYGVGAAAAIYYNKPLNELTLAQYAMLAGLPKAPSNYNPIVNPDRAIERRNYVLGRMLELKMINEEEHRTALAEPNSAKLYLVQSELEAPYVAEMARQELLNLYGEAAYESGIKVYTTVESEFQVAANRALRNKLLEYDMRHGYRGAEAHLDLAPKSTAADWQAALANYTTVGNLIPALVTEVGSNFFVAARSDGSTVKVAWEGMKWAARYINDNATGKRPDKAADVVKRGDVVRLILQGETAQLRQIPQVSSALVSLNPNTGAIYALIGGFDFEQSKFNRVTQAERQPGSNIKPFIYAAALDNGYTAASIINDAPIVFGDANLETEWRPQNYSGEFFGETRLREALIHSRNLVSIRILQGVGLNKAVNYLTHFGFDPKKIPHNLSMALGSGSVTPLELVRGYATIANGGFPVNPYFIDRIENSQGEVIYRSEPTLACATLAECQQRRLVSNPPPAEPIKMGKRVVSEQTLYILRSIMADIIKYGTGRGALSLKRNDIAGKTGTTNDQFDAWFSGFNNWVVTTAWVGFDTPRSLGGAETGGRAALPIWGDYMGRVLTKFPDELPPMPAGIVTVRINKETGEYATASETNGMMELFKEGTAPNADSAGRGEDGSGISPAEQDKAITEELF